MTKDQHHSQHNSFDLINDNETVIYDYQHDHYCEYQL